MARKKKTIEHINPDDLEQATPDLSEKLGEAFSQIINQNYGSFIAPKPFMTPIGVKHLDALLGGGIASSAPVMFTSTPETGQIRKGRFIQ